MQHIEGQHVSSSQERAPFALTAQCTVRDLCHRRLSDYWHQGVAGALSANAKEWTMHKLTTPLALLSLMVMGPPVMAQHSRTHEAITVDVLLESCSATGQTAHGKIPYFDCDSYIDGVIDSYLEVRNNIPKPERACFPASISPAQVLTDANALESNLDAGKDSAAPTLLRVLRKKYPCT